MARMRIGANILVFVSLMMCLARSSPACIWDRDTLRDEMRGLPGVAEVLAGRFEKRSDFFYRDRVARMDKWLVDHPDDQEAIDNLSVALFKVGEFERAVSVMQDKENRFPDQYTTASNLATFYMLHGDSASAIPLLEKALRINPNAHFGREEYQLKLAHFLVASATQPIDLHVRDFLGQSGFGDFSIRPSTGPVDPEQYEPWGRGYRGGIDLPQATRDKATTAIVGMIRFGTDASPDLYYALGNLLGIRGDKHLAIRAYLRSIELHHPQTEKVRRLAETLAEQIEDEEELQIHIEAFAKERAAGLAWSKAYMDFADDLIRDGKDPDLESNYSSFYSANGLATPRLQSLAGDLTNRERGVALVVFLGVTGIAVIIYARRVMQRHLSTSRSREA